MLKGKRPSNEMDKMRRIPYASTIGSLMYAMLHTGPNNIAILFM